MREIELGEVSGRAFRVVLRYLYTGEVPGSGGQKGGQSGRAEVGKGKVSKGEEGKGKGAKERDENDGGREVQKAADLFQAEGLLKHCLETFGRGLTVGTAVAALVWMHGSGPEARRMATEYFVWNCREIQVGGSAE